MHTHDTDELAGYYYSWDRNDRITRIDYTSIVAGPTSSTFSYDVTNQLTAADHSSQTDEDYEYDSNGNRLTANGATYTTGANNQLLSDGTFNYTYDAEGQRLTRTRISAAPADDHLVEYSWNHRGELSGVTFKNNSGTVTKTAEYEYDVFGRRISKAVDGSGPAAAAIEQFVYDGEHIALVFNGQSSLTNRYLHGPVIDQILADEQFSPLGPNELPFAPGDVYWALVDHLGTVHDLADSSGAVAKHLTYDSFGVIVSDTAPTLHHRFGFTARELDLETGNHYYRARYYEAPTARFLSEDPIYDDYQNPYRYVGNNPLTATDPSGMAVAAAAVPYDSGISIGVERFTTRVYSGGEDRVFWQLPDGRKLPLGVLGKDKWIKLYPAYRFHLNPAESKRDSIPFDRLNEAMKTGFAVCDADLADPTKTTDALQLIVKAAYRYDPLDPESFQKAFIQGYIAAAAEGGGLAGDALKNLPGGAAFDIAEVWTNADSDWKTKLWESVKVGGVSVAAAVVGVAAKRLVVCPRKKPVNLPSAKRVKVDIVHVASGHMKGGSRVSPNKDLFPEAWTQDTVERAIKEAYKGSKRIRTQGDRVLLQGTGNGTVIEMWLNTVTETIETAYPFGS